MKRLLLAGIALVGILALANAQVNFVPQPGITSGYFAKNTYSSAFFGLVPVVTAGTDEVCISGSASKVVRLQRLTIWGITTTATQNVAINLLRRVSLDTGGTAATTTANPGVTTQIASRDTQQAPNTAPTAVLVSYTAAPTIVDTAPVYLDNQNMFAPLAASVAAAVPVDFHYARDAENNLQVATLRGATQQICVNNAATLTNTNLWNGSIVWTEE
jgi:hypothetical protein